MIGRRNLLVLIIAIFLSFTSFGQILAKELVKVVVIGPGLETGVEVEDQDDLEFLRKLHFVDMTYEPLPGLANIYFEIHMAVGSGEEIVATDVYHYYPSTNGQPGSFYYADVKGGSSSAEGQWFLLSEDDDRLFRDLLARLGAPLISTRQQRVPNPTAVAYSSHHNQPVSQPATYYLIPIALIIICLLGLLVQAFLTRSRIKQLQ